MYFSANMKFFYAIYLPISSLDFIPTDTIYDYIFDFSLDEDKPYNEDMEEMGYETNCVILNLGSVFIYLAWYVVLFLIVLA